MSPEPNRAYMYAQLQAIDDAQPMTVYCVLCPKWKASGTAAVTRAASEAHRSKHHPELAGKRITVKKRSFSSAMTAEREALIEEERRQRMRALGLG